MNDRCSRQWWLLPAIGLGAAIWAAVFVAFPIVAVAVTVAAVLLALVVGVPE